MHFQKTKAWRNCHTNVAFILLLAFFRGDISSITPADETDYNADFELYVLRNDLTVNPFPERAAEMRTQAEAEGGLCNIQIPIYTDDNDSFLSAVVASVTESSECTVDVCRSEGCHACIDDDGGELTCEQCDTSDECDKKKNVVEYRYCDCDAVVTVNENNEFALFTGEMSKLITDW